MKRIIAYDGGSSKTEIAVFDDNGRLIYQKKGSGANHFLLDEQRFKEVISDLFVDALNETNLKKTDIDYVLLGLSGADTKNDFIKLNGLIKQIFKDIPFEIVNDAWLIMRSGLKTSFGAVAICGTGTNSAATNKKGKKAILRSLSFPLGIYGGGLDIASEALHYAFRSEELTHEKTILEKKIPVLFSCRNMQDVVELFYPQRKISIQQFGEITALVNKCAQLGDHVAQNILIKMGAIIGEQTAGVIKQVNIQNLKVPIVVGGRTFSGESPLFIDEFLTKLHRTCPRAYIVKPRYKPVVGAYLLALDALKIKQNQSIDNRLQERDELLCRKE